jgi:hypothetical protein
MNALEPLDSPRRQGENLCLPGSGAATGALDMSEQLGGTNRVIGPDVMVSYSSHDRAQVMQFVQRLRAAGVAAWIDQGGIDGAQKWGEEIVNAIDACKTVILMISATSMQSENINKEVMLAWENGKHFLPLCLEDAKIPKSMQYQLAGIQQIKLYEGDPEAKFVSVLRALVRLGVHVSPYYIALVSADLGDHEQAFEWLNRAVEQRASGLSRLKTEGRFHPLRSDPRFAQLQARAESLPPEPDHLVAAIPAFRPRPVATPVASAKPGSWWQKILWPDIVNDHGARQAVARGVWATVFLIVANILAALFLSSAGPSVVSAVQWSTAIVITVIFAPIAFGLQKMGRPAAIIGLILCAFGALGNLDKVQKTSATLDAYSAQYRQYQPYPQYAQGPYQSALALAYEQASTQYYLSWVALVVSLICVGAFTNATRGTFGYRRMVASHVAADKQDAITPEDLAAIKSKISGIFHKSGGASLPRPTVPRSQPRTAAAPPLSPPAAPSYPPSPHLPISAPAAPAEPPPTPSAPAPVPVQAEVAIAPAPLRQAFGATIGVSGGLIYWPRVGVFFLANLAAGLTFLIGRSMTTSFSVPPVYWLFAICLACVFTAATVAGFRFLSNVWAAASAAALAATLASLPFDAMLSSFAWADLFYREQFQQFILLPFVNSFILLMALVWVVPRLQPMVLALWLGAMGTEIATSLVANLLHALGAGDSPDAVLGGASVISAVLRSLAFALTLWGGLQYLRKKSAVSAG